MEAVDKNTLEDLLLYREIESTLFREAALLDAHEYAAWLEMLTDDVTYWAPIRSTRGADDIDHEFTKPGDAALFDEDRSTLQLRIGKRLSRWAWSEDPPSRTRHCITNVEILDQPAPNQVRVSSNFIVYRTRLDADEDWWVGRRIDLLRKEDGHWKIARRAIYLDQTVLTSKNLSTFL
jgi:3-phenylpropionate/cinnamic acid dioxygenase small subunit